MNFQKQIKVWSRLKEKDLSFFVESYYSIIYNITAKRVSNLQDREDLVQEIFIKIIKDNLFKKFRGHSEYEFLAFLTRVSINFIFNFFSSKSEKNNKLASIDIDDKDKSLLNLVNFSVSSTPASEFEKKEMIENLDLEIRKLPLEHQDIINLKLLSYTHKEISEILNIPLGTIDGRMVKILKTLALSLKKLQVDLS